MRQMDTLDKLQNTCVAIGCFDGMHSGHRAVVKALVERSRRMERTSVVIIPKIFQENRLLTNEEKAAWMEKMGVEILFTPQQEYAANQWEKWLDIREVILGETDKRRQYFEQMEIPVYPVQTVCYQEKQVDRIWLQTCIREGNPELAADLCDGNPYELSGVVVHGKALGRTVGMPTANLKVSAEKQMPAAGVYGTKTWVDGVCYLGVTNIGTRPTVDNAPEITIETMLLDFEGDLYGRALRTEICCFLRGIHKFSDLSQVCAQVEKDAERVRRKLGTFEGAD